LSNPKKKQDNRLKINEGIRASELRVLIDGSESQIMKKEDALNLAMEMGLDLIEISANAKPPVAKITDYGKFVYDQKKKQKEIKAKQHQVEVKSIQIRVGTGEADLLMKAKRASEWLKEGHRVKAELYLRGRTKYMDKKFLHDRLGKVLSLITESYKVVEDYKKNPKGIVNLIEPDKKGKKQKEKLNENPEEKGNS
jgi:translation initiation factor IF-3